jgi:hypothetical protein
MKLYPILYTLRVAHNTASVDCNSDDNQGYDAAIGILSPQEL